MFELFFSVIMPIGLITIMVGMGMSLSLSSFAGLLNTPLAAIIGLSAQLVLLPLVAFLLVMGFKLAGSVGLGLILLSACPGGVTSNALTYVARGDVALSIALTAVNSLAIIVTLPIIFILGNQLLAGDSSASVDVPTGMLMKQLTMLTVVPIASGMLIRHFFPGFAVRSEIWIRRFTITLLSLIFLVLLLSEFDFFLENALDMGSLVLGLMLITMSIGYGLARLAGLPEIQRFTILIEVGIQNTVVAVYLATNVLNDKTLAIVPSTYGILMMFVVGVVIFLRSRYSSMPRD